MITTFLDLLNNSYFINEVKKANDMLNVRYIEVICQSTCLKLSEAKVICEPAMGIVIDVI